MHMARLRITGLPRSRAAKVSAAHLRTESAPLRGGRRVRGSQATLASPGHREHLATPGEERCEQVKKNKTIRHTKQDTIHDHISE